MFDPKNPEEQDEEVHVQVKGYSDREINELLLDEEDEEDEEDNS